VIGGAVLGAAGVWVAAVGTGNHRNGRPELRDVPDEQPQLVGVAAPR
jgi:hypothetical protein